MLWQRQHLELELLGPSPGLKAPDSQDNSCVELRGEGIQGGMQTWCVKLTMNEATT